MKSLEATRSYFEAMAEAKVEAARRDPLGFLTSSMFAGAYVGIGIILIFSLGQTVAPALYPLVMGASFGIALTLVLFAGPSCSRATPCT